MSYYDLPPVRHFKREIDCYQQLPECAYSSSNCGNAGVYIPDSPTTYSTSCGPDHELTLEDVDNIDWSKILTSPHESVGYIGNHDHHTSSEDDTTSVCLSDEDVAMIESFSVSASPTNIQDCQSYTYAYSTPHIETLSISDSSTPHIETLSISDSNSSDSCNNNDNRLPSFKDLVHHFIPSNNASYNSSTSEEDDESEMMCRKGKRGAKNVLLWKFLLDQLGDMDQKHVRWINVKDGTFRFVDTNEISRLWGSKKRKNDMNFEKLSRGIRHYYKTGFMSRQDGTRLVYKFNWNKVPREYRKRFITR